MSRRKRRTFEADFKREAVALTKVGERSVSEVARDLDLTETALREWVKRAETEAAPAAGALSAVERDELLRLRKQVKRLEMEREILKKLRPSLPGRASDVRAREGGAGPLSDRGSLLGALGLAQRLYAWQRRPESAREAADAALVIDIRAAHQLGRRTYGSPRVHAELQAKGAHVSEKRVARLMPENGLRARQKRRFRRTTDSNHTDPIAPNVLQRDFEPEAPNRSWATGVTYLHTMEGWLYLAVRLDLFSRRVVGWATSCTNDRALALDALNRSLRTPPAGWARAPL